MVDSLRYYIAHNGGLKVMQAQRGRMGDGARGYGFDPKQRGAGAFYLSRDRGESWEPVLSNTPSILTAWVAAN